MPQTLNNQAVAIDPNLDAVVTRCPHARCKKPLPQCSYCLMPLFVVSHKNTTASADQQQLPLDSWVTWCQACHHGGCSLIFCFVLFCLSLWGSLAMI